jgi:hypothetical protein
LPLAENAGTTNGYKAADAALPLHAGSGE